MAHRSIRSCSGKIIIKISTVWYATSVGDRVNGKWPFFQLVILLAMPKTFREKPKKKITSPNFGIENMNLNVCFDYKFILKNLNRKVNKKTDKRKPKKKKICTHIECGERKFKYDCVWMTMMLAHSMQANTKLMTRAFDVLIKYLKMLHLVNCVLLAH